MSKFALLNASIWTDGYDFTGDSNSVSVTPSVDDLDVTTFGSGGAKELIAGLQQVELDVAGFWQAGTGQVDPEAFAELGTAGLVHTISATNTETQPVFAFKGLKTSYSLLGDVGTAAPFSMKGIGTSATVRGQIAKAKGTVSATGALGSVLTLGAPTSVQFVYAGLHVFGIPGTTITVQVQSDDNAGMSSPTTRATIGPITAAGGTWMTPVAGPFASEAYWRLNVSAITGSFTVAAWIAVQ